MPVKGDVSKTGVDREHQCVILAGHKKRDAEMRTELEQIMAAGDNRRFWGRYSRLYDFEIRHTSKEAYGQVCQRIASALEPDMDVLEVATGTGLIALGVAGAARSVTATDFSKKMVAAAKRKPAPENVSFSVEDAIALTFGTDTFDAAIISNALHIMPFPIKALSEIKRVLKPGGLLFAPTFSHGHIKQSGWDLNTRLLRLIGFETYSKWTPEEFVGFITNNGFSVDRWQVLKAAFPLVYLEAHSS
jgi:ubiquinone/menaquinone biosynthesis C-methylase UbiE